MPRRKAETTETKTKAKPKTEKRTETKASKPIPPASLDVGKKALVRRRRGR